MFESLGDRLQNALHKIKGYGKITEDKEQKFKIVLIQVIYL